MRLKLLESSRFASTVSAQIQPHSWIEPHPIQKVIQPQSEIDFETIEPQLDYNPILANFGIFEMK